MAKRRLYLGGLAWSEICSLPKPPGFHTSSRMRPSWLDEVRWSFAPHRLQVLNPGRLPKVTTPEQERQLASTGSVMSGHNGRVIEHMFDDTSSLLASSH